MNYLPYDFYGNMLLSLFKSYLPGVDFMLQYIVVVDVYEESSASHLNSWQ